MISLDANELSAEIQTNRGYSGGAQLRWLEATLRGWRSDPAVAPTIDFVVAFFHHCAYSTTAKHASDGGVGTRWTGCSRHTRSTWRCRGTTT